MPQVQDVAHNLAAQLSEGPPVRGQPLGGQGLDGVVEEEEAAVLQGVVLGLHGLAEDRQQLGPLPGHVIPRRLGHCDAQLHRDLIDGLGDGLDQARPQPHLLLLRDGVGGILPPIAIHPVLEVEDSLPPDVDIKAEVSEHVEEDGVESGLGLPCLEPLLGLLDGGRILTRGFTQTGHH